MPSTAPVSLEERLMLPLTLAASFGMAAAFFGTFELPGIWLTAGLALVYLAAGLPTGLRALGALFKDHVLDIDLLMIIAALAALAVGAPLEGAVLLTLFSISGTLEHRAMGRARRAIEAAKAEFEALGKRVLGDPRIGAHGTLIFFLHPKDMGGVLTEIMETPKTAH